MKISTNWIKKLIDIEDINLKELADKITHAGVNVEGVSESYTYDNIVVGYVESCVKHENSDHLNVCMVNIGNSVLQIVCGAQNVKAGIKVFVSLPGAVLPGNFEIKKSVIRGVESNGMICSLEELGFEEKSDGIFIIEDDVLIGSLAKDYLPKKDVVYTLDLNPNRKTDCLNHIGFAYEVGSVLGRTVKMPDVSFEENKESIKNNYSLSVETDKCLLYLAKLVKNVTIKESPNFIKERLESAGVRSINNIVDISNYVMLEYGQPLHFFDADKLGNKIIVRDANDNENVKTLDGNDRVLTNKDVVITNGENVVAIAGVMGAENTEVTENTKNILIESAIFDPLSVRYTSIKLDLRSESSLRYEVGLNYEYTLLALKRACHLLEKYATGEVTSDILEYDNIKKEMKNVSVSLSDINNLLGTNIVLKEVEEIFKKLGFKCSITNEVFNVTIPNRRLDVSIKEDLIEEVGRIYGFDKIKPVLNNGVMKLGGYSKKAKMRKDASLMMKMLGFDEVRTYSLISDNQAKTFNCSELEYIKLLKPISNDKTIIRKNLIGSLIDVVNYNNSRNVKDISIYEISNTYYKENKSFVEELKLGCLSLGNVVINEWNKVSVKTDFYYLKGVLVKLLEYLGYSNRFKFVKDSSLSFIHPGVCAKVMVDNCEVGYIGKINPSVSKKEMFVFELSLEKLFNKKISKIKYKTPNKYPSIKLDMAFLFDKSVVSSDVVNDIYKLADKSLTDVSVFDVFEKDGEKSIAFSLVFEDYEKTLNDEEVKIVFDRIITGIINKYNAELRNK